jgi:hypothetical protein
MDEMLQNRIQALIGGDMPMAFQEGGEVDKPGPFSKFELDLVEGLEGEETSMMAEQAVMSSDSEKENLAAAIDDLMMARDAAEDDDEKVYIDGLLEAANVSSQAPMADLALQLSEAGRGGDVTLAHVRPGEIVLPPESMDDPQFEAAVERRLIELDLDPQAAVVGAGIASLNPITGLEEFGWFKKTWKSVKKVVKKVVKPIAQVAQFIPGPWQVPAALISKAYTVYDVAKGRANPLALASVFAPLPGASGAAGAAGTAAATSRGIGSLSSIGEAAGNFLRNPISSITSGIGSLGRGLADVGGRISEFVLPGADKVGLLGNIGKGIGSLGDYVFEGDTPGNLFTNLRRDVLGTYTTGQADPELVAGLRAQGLSEERISEIIQGMGRSAGDVMTTGTTMGRAELSRRLGIPDSIAEMMESPEIDFDSEKLLTRLRTDPQYASVISEIEGSLGGIYPEVTGAEGTSYADTILQQLFPPGQAGPAGSSDQVAQEINRAADSGETSLLDSLLGGLGNVFNSNLARQLGPVALAAYLAKLAYDEAKDRKGVPLNELTTMPSYGAPPMPTLSGGRPKPAPPASEPQPVMARAYGGPVMAFAKGGDVAVKDFVEMDGKINGPGTETSDDIPAMLSDGEFVMTGRAVRGAGAFDMDKGDGGIITLTPNGSESRDKGTELMYEMMDLFAEYADKPKSKRAAA